MILRSYSTKRSPVPSAFVNNNSVMLRPIAVTRTMPNRQASQAVGPNRQHRGVRWFICVTCPGPSPEPRLALLVAEADAAARGPERFFEPAQARVRHVLPGVSGQYLRPQRCRGGC